MRDRFGSALVIVLAGTATAVLLLSGCAQQGTPSAEDTTTQESAQTGTEQETPASQDATARAEIPASNVTTLGLYVTPTEAYEMWEADPKRVHFLDVRTFEEYIFIGHIASAKNVPFSFPKYDPAGETMPGAPAGCSGDLNPDFVASVQESFDERDTILVMCGTGGRAAQAINALADAGFTNVYNIVHGFEGESVDDPESVYDGKHMVNGWKNEGLPWTYASDPSLMWVEPSE